MRLLLLISMIPILFSFTRNEDKLSQVLKDYMPYVPPEQNADSLYRYFAASRDFIADSIGTNYLKGDLKNFNPLDLRPVKFVVEVEKYGPSSFYYATRACLDTSVASKKILEKMLEKLHLRLNGLFSKSIASETERHEKFPYKTYNYYGANSYSPALLIGWGYNESKKFTGYYFEITLYSNVPG